MNPYLDRLQPYPFQKLSSLVREIKPNPSYGEIILSIGEPKHATPEFIKQALTSNLDGLAKYPTTLGSEALRLTISDWLKRRYSLDLINPQTQVLPVNGSREALFSFAQAIVNPTNRDAIVVCPNPFYQIYEGAAILAGSTPHFINTLAQNNFAHDFDQLPKAVWQRIELIYVCSPGNPTGAVITLEEWKKLFALSDQHGFVIASDECYSEIFFDEQKPPIGALQAAKLLGRDGFPRLVVFSSLSKRSNVPGMRSGFVAGNAEILEKYLAYRTYHGCAMNPAVQAASLAAWKDEDHVVDNRRLYREKFMEMARVLRTKLEIRVPEGGFYLWVKTPINDIEFARKLYRHYNVLVLPGSYLAREARSVNPGASFVRIALVPNLDECVEAAKRINDFLYQL